MNITLSENTTSPQKSQLQNRFEKLWREVKNKQLANAKLKNELAELHKTYHEIILPVEQLTEEPYTQLGQRLIEFFSRKSLTQWQRHELSQWIIECIEHIEPLNPAKSRELTTSYHQILADLLDLEVEDLEEEMNQSADEIDEFFEQFDDLGKAFRDLVDDEDHPGAPIQDDLFGVFENGEDRETDDKPKFEDFFSSEDHQEKPSEQNLFSDKWLRNIFRRTANALHPDKARNEATRKEKEGLMTQLLIARQENDVFGLLNLYMQYVDSDDLLITHETMQKLCEQLKEQKNQLAEDKDQLLYENPMYAALYERLHSRSKKKRDQNIERHIQGVQESIQELLEFVASLRNLTVLKTHLEYRYQEHRFAIFNDEPFEFDDF
jgi:hypothetical protein